MQDVTGGDRDLMFHAGTHLGAGLITERSNSYEIGLFLSCSTHSVMGTFIAQLCHWLAASVR